MLLELVVNSIRSHSEVIRNDLARQITMLLSYVICHSYGDYSFLLGQAALFADLTSQPQLPSHNPDPLCVTVRTQFLCRVITGAMQTIQKVESDENGQDDEVFVLLIVKGVLYLDCNLFWVEKVQMNHTYAITGPQLK
jgi:hypothetical protein